jgi:hypothetical protein
LQRLAVTVKLTNTPGGMSGIRRSMVVGFIYSG